ncbi:MAG TPA: response regulator [Actinomycetota bacterium]
MRTSDDLIKANVLIVDDEETNVMLLERILQRAGYEHIASTTDPTRVRALHGEFKPDIIILDLMMPHMDGFEVMEELSRHIPDGTYLPILVLTADSTPEARRRALAMGARDFLLKPFDQDEALLRIRNLLETRRLHLELISQNESLEEKVRERTIELERSLETLRRTSEQRRTLLAHLADVHRTAASALGEDGSEGGDGAAAELGATE